MLKKKRNTLKKLIASSERYEFEFSPLEEKHVRMLFVAYKKGTFDRMELADDLTPLEFIKVLEDLSVGSKLYVYTDNTGNPMVLITLSLGGVPEVHAYFTQRASDRQRLMIGVLFFGGVGKTRKVITQSSNAFLEYFKRISSYGILRKVGDIEDAYPDEDNTTGTVFQARNVNTKLLTPIEV